MINVGYMPWCHGVIVFCLEILVTIVEKLGSEVLFEHLVTLRIFLGTSAMCNKFLDFLNNA